MGPTYQIFPNLRLSCFSRQGDGVRLLGAAECQTRQSNAAISAMRSRSAASRASRGAGARHCCPSGVSDTFVRESLCSTCVELRCDAEIPRSAGRSPLGSQSTLAPLPKAAVSRTLGRTFSFIRVALIGITAGSILACGPELNTPGSGDVSGTWTAPGPAGGLTDITLVLQQAGDGTVTGTFQATGTPSLQKCPSTGACALASTVEGVNTVLQVNLELVGAGSFTGQLITSTRLRGTMSHTVSGVIEFTRAEPRVLSLLY